MKNLFLLALPALLAAALPTVSNAQQRPQPQATPQASPATRSQAPAMPAARTQTAPASRAAPAGQNRYGRWNSAWGKAPPAPPAHFTKVGDWHRHVRACQQRFRSYAARTDTYRTHSGKLVRCKL